MWAYTALPYAWTNVHPLSDPQKQGDMSFLNDLSGLCFTQQQRMHAPALSQGKDKVAGQGDT